MGNPFRRVAQLIGSAGQTASDEAKKRGRVPAYTPSGTKQERPPALQGGGGMGTEAFTPKARPTVPVTQRRTNLPAYQGPGAQQGAARNPLTGVNQGQYQRQLSGEAYGVTPGQYYSGIGDRQVPYDVTQIPDVQRWQQEMDYRDAGERAQNRAAINSFSGIPRYIFGQAREIDTGLNRLLDAYRDPYGKVEQVRLNRGAPAVSEWQEMPAYQAPRYMGGGGGGGWPNYGGGGGGGGRQQPAQTLPPWFYGMASWRV